MSDELKELQLKAARAALEREELALQREREESLRSLKRKALLEAAVEETAIAGHRVASVTTKVGRVLLGYLGRLTLMLLLWALGVVAFTAYLYFKEVPKGVSSDFSYIAGYVLAASVYYAPWICLIAAFFRFDADNSVALVALGGLLIVGIQKLGSPSFFVIAGDFKEHIAQDVLAYAQQPGLGEQERLNRYAKYFDHVPCGKKGTATPLDEAYQEQLRLIEREHPRLNPDSVRHQPGLVTKAAVRMADYQRAGYTACKALRLAADEVTVWR